MDTGGAGRLSDSILGKRPSAVLCATDGPSSSQEEGGDIPSGQPTAKLIIKVDGYVLTYVRTYVCRRRVLHSRVTALLLILSIKWCTGSCWVVVCQLDRGGHLI